MDEVWADADALDLLQQGRFCSVVRDTGVLLRTVACFESSSPGLILSRRWLVYIFLQKPWTWGVDAFQLPSSKSASQIGHSLTLISVHKKFIKRSNFISMCFTLSNAPEGEFGSWIQFFYGFLRNAPQNLILYMLVQLHNSCRFIFMFSFFRLSPASSGRPRSRSSLITSMVLGLAFPKRARDDNVWNKT